MPNNKSDASLGRIAERLNVIVITCAHCRRRDQYSLWKLIAKYGADASVEPLQQEIVTNCPHKGDASCAPLCPALPEPI